MATSRTSAGVGLGVGIFLLALATAIIHLYLGLSFGNTLFVLNGLGYLERVMNLAEKPHQNADSSINSVPCRSPVFRISKPILSKFITASSEEVQEPSAIS